MSSSNPVVVVTGASSGIGLASAEIFAREGWHVIATGRDPQRSAAAIERLRAAAGSRGKVDFVRGDFAIMREVEHVAERIAELTDTIDVLVNNAGGVRDAIHISTEGVEATFAANHLAPFLLTRKLLPLLQRAAATSRKPARVIAVSSSAHEHVGGMNWDDLMYSGGSAGEAYCQAKLANLLFTRELSRRLSDSGIVAQAMHPGMVATNFASHGGQQMQEHFARNEASPPDEAAQTIYWVATSEEAGRQGARYFHNKAEVAAAPQARDDDAAQRLWAESETLLQRLLR